MSYLRKLESLDPGSSLLNPAPIRLVLLTGQSSFASANLSGAQSAFLREVAPPSAAILEAGFPYHPGMLTAGEWRPPAILAASWRNALQVLWCLSSPRYQVVVREVLQRAVDSTERQLLLITGSCGLQLANRAWPGLRFPGSLDLRIVALGPTCFGRLNLAPANVTVVRGGRDVWSKLLYRGPVDVSVTCGHLDYWSSREVRDLVADLLGRPS